MTRSDAVGLLRAWRAATGDGDKVSAARFEERVIAAMMFAPADPAAEYRAEMDKAAPPRRSYLDDLVGGGCPTPVGKPPAVDDSPAALIAWLTAGDTGDE